MLSLEDGSVVPVEKSELPVKLPKMLTFPPKPLEIHEKWKKTYKKNWQTSS